jgi:O-succinylhomoserine sulfhydrylase
MTTQSLKNNVNIQDFDGSGTQVPVYHPDTVAVRGGVKTTEEGEHSDAVFLTSSFMFPSAEAASGVFQHGMPGNVYSRFSNPTVKAFERRLAALEGGEACVATASGMAACTLLVMTALAAGDHVVAGKTMFGSTITLFTKIFKKFSVDVTLVEVGDTEAWRAAIRPETKLLFVESPTNPCIDLADIKALAAMAHDNGALLAVDNCFCSPVLQRPLELGADVVMHSATKYLDGQGRAVGGALVGSQAFVGEQVQTLQRSLGFTMGAFDAWIFQKGLETLPIRVAKHCENANALAAWLEQHPKVKSVNHPSLPSHKQHELAKQQQSDFGGVLAFELAGGREAAWAVIDATQLLSRTANLGDVRTTITHPATTTHGRLSDEDRAQAGINEGMIRLSVGLEHIEDIKADLDRGLSAL